MSFLLIKNPSNIEFVESEYVDNEVVISKTQVRYKGQESNSKLLRLANGEWCIKIGSDVYFLTKKLTQETKIVELSESGGKFIDDVEEKWFVSQEKRTSDDFAENNSSP